MVSNPVFVFLGFSTGFSQAISEIRRDSWPRLSELTLPTGSSRRETQSFPFLKSSWRPSILVLHFLLILLPLSLLPSSNLSLRLSILEGESQKNFAGISRPVSPLKTHETFVLRLHLLDDTTRIVQGRVIGFVVHPPPPIFLPSSFEHGFLLAFILSSSTKPLRNRRNGQTTSIGEGMTEYLLDGASLGYGMSEYLDQSEEDPKESKL